jgi:hypothetical protein
MAGRNSRAPMRVLRAPFTWAWVRRSVRSTRLKVSISLAWLTRRAGTFTGHSSTHRLEPRSSARAASPLTWARIRTAAGLLVIQAREMLASASRRVPLDSLWSRLRRAPLAIKSADRSTQPSLPNLALRHPRLPRTPWSTRARATCCRASSSQPVSFPRPMAQPPLQQPWWGVKYGAF